MSTRLIMCGNLAQYSSSTNNSISMLWGSLETLKNSLATAFAPILSVVAPILSKFIDMLSTAASYVRQLMLTAKKSLEVWYRLREASLQLVMDELL